MTDRAGGASPQVYARTAGWLYLYIIFAGAFAEVFVRGRLIVPGDAAATAKNIVAHHLLFRLGGAAELLVFGCDIALALIFYILLRPVNRNLALLAAFFRLAMAAILAVNTLNHFAAVLILDGKNLTAFAPDQLQTLVLLSLRLQAYGYHIGLVFFGFHCLVLGYLIAASGFMPKVIGVLLAAGAACYIANSLASLVIPDHAAILSPGIFALPFISELSLCLWLLLKGASIRMPAEKARPALFVL